MSGQTTDNLSEGISNLYYSDARVDTRLTANSVTVLNVFGNLPNGTYYYWIDRNDGSRAQSGFFVLSR